MAPKESPYMPGSETASGRYPARAPRGHPGGNEQAGKTLIHIQQSAPMVERRPLAAYEGLAGGAR